MLSCPPLVGETAAIIRIVEDLPAPLGPRKPNASPRRTSMSMPLTASTGSPDRAGNDLRSPRARIITSLESSTTHPTLRTRTDGPTAESRPIASRHGTPARALGLAVRGDDRVQPGGAGRVDGRRERHGAGVAGRARRPRPGGPGPALLGERGRGADRAGRAGRGRRPHAAVRRTR